MTPIDLRVIYKLQTGKYPNKEKTFFSCSQYENDDDYFTLDYINWLGNNQERQLYYKRDTGFLALYYDGKPAEKYIQWLEDIRKDAYSVLEDLRK